MKKIQPPVRFEIPRFAYPFAVLLLAALSIPALSQDDPEQPPEEADPAVVRPMVSTGVEAEAIARKRPDTAVWLTDENGNRVLALFQPEQDSPAKGALLILADEGMSPASGIADALRGPLSDAGWGVMIMALPAPPFAVQQWLKHHNNNLQDSDEETDEQAQTEENGTPAAMINVVENKSPDEGLNQYRDQVVMALTTGVDALGERDYERIVLAGIGRAAGHVTRQVRRDGRASDIVWIAPHFHADESDSLTELLAAASSPSILEIYSTFPGEETADRSARERAAALERAGISGYRRQPAAMARRPQPREAKMLANRISAWLQSTSSQR